LRALLSEAISLKSVDCFGKKRLAMTRIPTRNEYILPTPFVVFHYDGLGGFAGSEHFFKISFDTFGFALPAVAFITWPTRKPKTFSSPVQ
jgi:hypothetical protein